MAGKQYTSSHPTGGLYDPRVTLEKILRPIESYQQRRDQALAKLRAPPTEEEEESEICWGGPGSFTFDEIDGGGIKTDPPDEEEPVGGGGTHGWTEIGRAWQNIRVENPDDSEQYVIVQRIDWISFTPPGGDPRTWNTGSHKFTLKHPEQKKRK